MFMFTFTREVKRLEVAIEQLITTLHDWQDFAHEALEIGNRATEALKKQNEDNEILDEAIRTALDIATGWCAPSKVQNWCALKEVLEKALKETQ